MSKTTKKSESVDSENIEPIYSINGQVLKKAFYAALVWLKNHQQVIQS